MPTRALRPLHIVLIATIALLVAAGGYTIGRDMAHRDAARDASR